MREISFVLSVLKEVVIHHALHTFTTHGEAEAEVWPTSQYEARTQAICGQAWGKGTANPMSGPAVNPESEPWPFHFNRNGDPYMEWATLESNV